MGCRAAADAVLRAVGERDVDMLVAWATTDVCWQVANWEGGPRVISRVELGEFVDALARHHDHTRVEEVVEIAGAVIVRQVVDVRKPPGTPYGGTQFALFECRDCSHWRSLNRVRPSLVSGLGVERSLYI